MDTTHTNSTVSSTFSDYKNNQFFVNKKLKTLFFIWNEKMISISVSHSLKLHQFLQALIP